MALEPENNGILRGLIAKWRLGKGWRLPTLPMLPINRSVLASIAFAAFLLIWVFSGLLSGKSDAVEVAKPISETVAELQRFKVAVRVIESEAYRSTLTFQARTEADQIVTLASETTGVIVAQDIAKGSFVQKGQVVCKIDVGARAAQLDEARALLQSRKIEYDAAKKLLEKGHTSASQVASAKAAYDAAQAGVKLRQVELNRTAIKAPFDGILDDVPIEEGDFITIGQSCARIIDKDPLLIVAYVAENKIKSLQMGARGVAQLATGEIVQGAIHYIAESPDTTTRTFRIEVRVPNKDLNLRDGITAELQVDTGEVQASFIPQGVLTLNSNGQIGVRVIEGKQVAFRPVDILSDARGGAYVVGLKPQETIITVGSEFTRAGQEVEFEMEQHTNTTPNTEAF